MPRVYTGTEREAIALRMRQWRKSHNLSQDEAASLFGVQRAGWARWERGEVYPTGCRWALETFLESTPPGSAKRDRAGQRPIRVEVSRQVRMQLRPAIDTSRRSRSEVTASAV